MRGTHKYSYTWCGCHECRRVTRSSFGKLDWRYVISSYCRESHDLPCRYLLRSNTHCWVYGQSEFGWQRGQNVPLLHIVQSGCRAHPATSLVSIIGALYPGIKRQELETDHSPMEVDLHLLMCLHCLVPNLLISGVALPLLYYYWDSFTCIHNAVGMWKFGKICI